MKSCQTHYRSNCSIVGAAAAAADGIDGGGGTSSGNACEVLADFTWPFCRALTAPDAEPIDGWSGDASVSVRLLDKHVRQTP